MLCGTPLDGTSPVGAVVEVETADGAVGIDVVVCVVTVGAIIVGHKPGQSASVAPVQGSTGTFITMVRGVR